MADRKAGVIARMGLMTAVMLVLGAVERMFPIAPTLPGVRLGLANSVVLFALYSLGAQYAALLTALKILLNGFMFSGVSGMLYALSGGALSLAVMLTLKRIRGVSVIGVSVASAAAHNVGQLLMARWVSGSWAVFGYLPILLVSGICAGIATGICAKTVLTHISNK